MTPEQYAEYLREMMFEHRRQNAALEEIGRQLMILNKSNEVPRDTWGAPIYPVRPVRIVE